MYIPKNFLIADKQEAIDFMQRYSFATVITVKDGILNATHLPFLVTVKDGQIILSSHFAKANPQADEIINCKPLIIFTEPHAYISPKHYDQVSSVPTWNYIAIHAYGMATLIEDIDGKMDLLEQTINYYEAGYLQQWKGLPDEFKLKMLKGITGFQIIVDDLQAKQKLSQNKNPAEREKIIAELSQKTDSNEKAVAEYMAHLK